MFNKIINPLTGKKVSIFSKNGKELLKNYVKISLTNGGATLGDIDPSPAADEPSIEDSRENALVPTSVDKVNYKGMWYPQPKPLLEMDRTELLERLRGFRDVWEIITGNDMDLSDGRLNDETDAYLRKLIEDYFTEDSRLNALAYLQ